MSVSLFIALEVGIREGAYLVYGFNSYFLFCGSKSWMADDDPEGHSAAFEGYFKFPASRILHQYGMFANPTPIRINSLGFRGKDFSPQKEEGTYRIVCLGWSSTFGFFNRDDYTYPAILERLFDESVKDRKVEVINAGIPHFSTDALIVGSNDL